ncbi:MAG: D-alanyl-D-alanine carboxypeptidase family protein, partial [Clostridia bacterium]|nr:D-alanyl-D-alanine carboxypeptidase family protein [Clostridia bacterium]
MTACREAGNAPYICSAYRSFDTQTQLFENKIARVMAEGHSRAEAEDIAAREVARPGTSEH